MKTRVCTSLMSLNTPSYFTDFITLDLLWKGEVILTTCSRVPNQRSLVSYTQNLPHFSIQSANYDIDAEDKSTIKPFTGPMDAWGLEIVIHYLPSLALRPLAYPTIAPDCVRSSTFRKYSEESIGGSPKPSPKQVSGYCTKWYGAGQVTINMLKTEHTSEVVVIWFYTIVRDRRADTQPPSPL